MALTELQRKQLIEKINNLPLKTILNYFLSGDITFSDVPELSPERKAYIEEQINNMPNPTEQSEWNEIKSMIQNSYADIAHKEFILQKLTEYIGHWDSSRPNGNHVDEARNQYNIVLGEIKELTASVEDNDWKMVDHFSKISLIDHLNKYPQSTHKSEIDNEVWNLTNKESEQDIKDYITLFPNGNNSTEAYNLHNSIIVWNDVKNSEDIFTVNNYLKSNPNSPYMFQCQTLLISLKQRELNTMRERPNEYEAQRLLNIINEGIFSENELINSRVITKSVLDTIKHANILTDLPDIRQAISSSSAECKDGYTDVYFFGVPSTGKTCVLMGLSRSDSLHINLAAGGGDYASALQQYTDMGVTVPRTPGTFVTTLEATISGRANNGVDHKINLVEMSGEEFAFGIANNPEHIFTFEDMGSGATELLRNDNRKVFFLIIDPTANVVRINREVVDGYDEQTGAPITHLEYCVVNQRTLIQKMVNIFENEGNAEIMKKVDSIHIIMTKSDTLGNPVVREDRAYEIFQDKFGHYILEPLMEMCKEYNINAHTQFRPKLYTFSLGTFYIGGLYEYEQTDSNRLVKAIRNSTHGSKKKSWWDRLKETVN
jgi:hypothetical protein